MASPYRLDVVGLDKELRVKAFRAREAMSEAYEIAVECYAESSDDIAGLVVGRQARFTVLLASPPQVFHGIVRSVSLVGYGRVGDATMATYAITLAPRFWLLEKKRRSRVFQQLRVDQVAKEVLDEARIPSLWLLQHTLPVREYCTQYEETDADFVKRLMAEVGVMFFFLHPSLLPTELAALGGVLDGVLGAAGGPAVTGEVMVFADDTLAYHGLGELPSALETLLRTGLGELGRQTGGVAGQVAGAVGAAADVVADLGGPDLRSVMALGNSRTLSYRPDGDGLVEDSRDLVRSFVVHDAVQSDAATYRVYDPRRPLANLVFSEKGSMVDRAASALGIDLPDELTDVVGAAASVAGAIGGVAGDIGSLLGGAVEKNELEIYEHHDAFLLPDWDHAKTEPRRILLAAQRDRRTARGMSPCPLLSCGRRFTLGDHPLDWVNREYVLVEVRHEGRAHEGPSDGTERPVYENHFTCVPSDVIYVPERPPARIVQACLTAKVIDPADATELLTHTMGEVKVRFHWERGQRGTCWVRTMQAWSGAGWGTQFMPRVGMEVVVGFDGGDPDRPIVLGCLYNGVHPTPFALPDAQTRSGIRTRSTPNGEGSNELSFEDRQGQEQVYLHAERDLLAEVENDRRLLVQHDDDTRVLHDQRLVVRGKQQTRVDGGQTLLVTSERRVEVEGSHDLVTRGNRSERVTQNLQLEVRGALQTQTGGLATTVLGDVTGRVDGSSSELVRGSSSVRVEGNSDLGSGGVLQLASDEEILLRCGQSSIRVSDGRIEITSPEIILAAEDATQRLGGGDVTMLTTGRLQAIADTALIKSSGASFSLTSEAAIDGAKVLLNSPENADDSVTPEQIEPTILELRDQDGRPVAHQRYRIELADGTALTGVLDDEGRAEVRIEGSAEVVFPDRAEVEPA